MWSPSSVLASFRADSAGVAGILRPSPRRRRTGIPVRLLSTICNYMTDALDGCRGASGLVRLFWGAARMVLRPWVRVDQGVRRPGRPHPLGLKVRSLTRSQPDSHCADSPVAADPCTLTAVRPATATASAPVRSPSSPVALLSLTIFLHRRLYGSRRPARRRRPCDKTAAVQDWRRDRSSLPSRARPARC